jgi:PhnB protein
MSEVDVTETLNRIIDAVLKGEAAGTVNSSEAELAELAAELRGLPRQDFKMRLRNELEEGSMSTTATEIKKSGEASAPSKAAPRAEKSEGPTSVTPYVIVSDVHRQIDFIKEVFGAEGKIYGLGSQGGYHSECRIGDSLLMVGGGGEGSKWKGTPVPVSLHVYVQDVDGVYQQAIQAGATSLMPPTDMTYGERGAAIQDPDGNHWYVATAFGPTYVPEGVPNMMPFFNPRGAKKLITFLTDALAAETLAVHESSDGIVRHAELRIGASVVEMGEAHDQWQPRPMHFMVNVEDCDTAYERAIKAEGAISVSVPANAPYGGRTGTIEDPFGNTWYLHSPTQKTEEPENHKEQIDG